MLVTARRVFVIVFSFISVLVVIWYMNALLASAIVVVVADSVKKLPIEVRKASCTSSSSGW